MQIPVDVPKSLLQGRNILGFYMESQLKSQTHKGKVCGTEFYTLKNVARICILLTLEVAKIIIQELVFSKLHYCNGLLF